jgi:hypothetical protein
MVSLISDRFSRKGLREMNKNWFSKVTKGAMVQAAVVLIVPVTCSMAFAACSDLAGKGERIQTSTIKMLWWERLRAATM